MQPSIDPTRDVPEEVLWPAERDFAFSELSALQSLRSAWEFSRQRIHQLRNSVRASPLPEPVAGLAVSGSLSRMEAHADSDLDLLIVIDDRQRQLSEHELGQIYSDTWQRLQQAVRSSELHPPRPGGVFSQCVSWAALTDPSVRGIVNEEPVFFGQRMQLLLDAQPLCNNTAFHEIQQDILNWYQETRVACLFSEAGPFHWLWQDVQRYWRSIRSRACWLHHDEPTKSLEVNLKLRSSRLVLIAAFLLSLMTAQAGKETTDTIIADLQNQLRRTPLERLADLARDPNERHQLLSSYQQLWERVRSGPDRASAPTDTDLQSMAHIRDYVCRRCAAQSSDWVC
ncbi:MAG: nucleotidyltransferase domain-containing protein [Fuerstiella sp.]